MKKIIASSLLLFLVISLSGCASETQNQTSKPATWQGTYYEHGLEENEEYGPVFDNYEACESWAFAKKSNSDDYLTCSKNCHSVLDDGTPICEEVVRNWQPLPGGVTFGTYKE